MNVLVIGSGGREHALAWALSRSPGITQLCCIPGNPGIAEVAECIPLKPSDHEGIARFVERNGIDLVVVGPEAPLAEGITDDLAARGIAVFGPTRRAAELEWSKAFAKEFMARHGVPTALYRTFSGDQRAEAHAYIRGHAMPLVLKADGLAAGKGVVVCQDRAQALAVLDDMLAGKAFGQAGARVVVEEFLQGEEASVFAIADGSRFVTLAPAQDHKRAFDGDRGKNTGGMGAYAPSPFVPREAMSVIETTIIEPVLRGMRVEGRPYRGCLYVGLMMTAAGPKVIEFNCRFGDPETQVVLPLYRGDLGKLLLASAQGALDDATIAEARSSVRGTAACVVLASGGYPDEYQKGFVISGLSDAAALPGIQVFHSGTARADNAVVTAGGRVLAVTAFNEGDDLEPVLHAAYEAVQRIAFTGMHYRRDIGARAIAAQERSRQ